MDLKEINEMLSKLSSQAKVYWNNPEYLKVLQTRANELTKAKNELLNN